MISKKNFSSNTDSYNENSMKTQERKQQGMVTQLHHLDGPTARIPPDMKLFLQNDFSKKQLCHLLLRVWSSKEAASWLEGCMMVALIVEGMAQGLTGADGGVAGSKIHNLHFKQVCFLLYHMGAKVLLINAIIILNIIYIVFDNRTTFIFRRQILMWYYTCNMQYLLGSKMQLSRCQI